MRRESMHQHSELGGIVHQLLAVEVNEKVKVVQKICTKEKFANFCYH